VTLWLACCYFIILSVLFADGDRSLLASPSDLLVCWCESGLNVVLVSLLSLSVSSWRADRRLLFLREWEITQSFETTGRSIRRRAEWPSDELDRCVLTRLVCRVLVCGLHSSDAFWRRFWTDVRNLFSAPEVVTAEVVVDCSWVLNRVVNCRRSVEFVTVNSVWTQSELLSGRQRRLSSVSVYLWAKVVRPLIATWWLVRLSTASLFAVGE